MSKPKYIKAVCKHNRLGLEVGIKIDKEYSIVSMTQRYVTIKNDYGVMCQYWLGFFQLVDSKGSLQGGTNNPRWERYKDD